jgi:hypothetical protein
MKTKIQIALFLVIILTFALPVTALAKDRLEDKIVLGGTYLLESGEELPGTLVVFGGSATLEEGSRVTEDVVILGGTLEANGEINGSLVGIGGQLTLGNTAVVDGDLVLIGASVDQAVGATVNGEVVNGLTGPIYADFPQGITIPRFELKLNPFVQFGWILLRTFLWAILAVVLVLFLPRQFETIGSTAVNQVLISGGLGLLTIIIAPLILIFLLITLICSPLSLLGFLLLTVAWGVGLIGLGLEIGRRIAGMFKAEWAPALSAGVGTLVLIFVLNGLQTLIPCVGWILPTLAGSVGLGAVMLTRFGTHAFPGADQQVPVPPPPLAPTPPELPLPPLPPVEPMEGQADEEIPPAS